MNPNQNQNKYPNLCPNSEFTKKLLVKRNAQKYFDSADYQMAMQWQHVPAKGEDLPITGSLIPTPVAIAATKLPLAVSKLALPQQSQSLPVTPMETESSPIDDQQPESMEWM
ncbi:cAMP-regulated phosphoprotein 19-A-like [Drosophila obscura]|uniref:cAMP-regulated phosphoprotein 19-A-like n=1 Tax=Drosophila obscura TaxID=7282 RepID=UPI000BA05AB6|nr:cAMP-regulated phosphoprotein 19-A-like [Drosophila obscura]XP_022214085.1 cAMP-regulated phosphoprotein 19-A-like [Drosophila obscura]